MIINPFLLAGKDQIEAYQSSRIKDWEAKKGTSTTDFDHYFSELASQWEMDDSNHTRLDAHDFNAIDDIDFSASNRIHSALKNANILNSNGYLNLNTTTIEATILALDEFNFLSTDQKTTLSNMLNNIQRNRPVDFETYTQDMFTYLSSDPNQTPYKITPSQSKTIWTQLHANGIIDDFGILLIATDSDELTASVQSLSGLRDAQKERVLQLLKKHPELSYHSYLKNRASSSSVSRSSRGSGPGIYLPHNVKAATQTGLTQDELNHIKILAVLEWNVMLMSQKSIHKTRKKSVERRKKEKKETQQDSEKYLAKMEAQHRQRNAARRSEQRQSSSKK
ncbi:MAG: hypothetical protein ACO3K7_00610 [Candidatus Marinamargulisbacteria bacterium]